MASNWCTFLCPFVLGSYLLQLCLPDILKKGAQDHSLFLLLLRFLLNGPWNARRMQTPSQQPLHSSPPHTPKHKALTPPSPLTQYSTALAQTDPTKTTRFPSHQIKPKPPPRPRKSRLTHNPQLRIKRSLSVESDFYYRIAKHCSA